MALTRSSPSSRLPTANRPACAAQKADPARQKLKGRDLSLIKIADTAFIHPSAQLYGKVRVGDGASVWCNAVVRSEIAHVEIHEAANIQDFVMIHTDPGKPVIVGAYTSVTHHATLHGCTIGDHCLIGINATIYNGAVIGSGSIVGQHAYVRDGTIVPPNSIVVGSPAKVISTR
ncbi:MAG: gamma carbonic anhydrase family protein, partial [Sandarakinorhabdus sp.]|nr:gamma carbonic anhydrase family protein [Sandarakinorhabdus sp.]